MATPVPGRVRAAGHSAVRLARFTKVMFRPRVYVTYGVLWALALEGTGAVLSGTGHGWSVSWATAGRVVTVVLVLLYLRMVDEQKDLDYDRVHHPDRPLVTGAITATELRAGMAVIVCVIGAIGAVVSPPSLIPAFLALGYGLLLARWEKASPRVRDGILLNLCVSYPVQILIGIHLYVSAATTGVLRADWRVVPLLALFAGAFLHVEFARKTRWDAGADERLYSRVLGGTGAALTSLACGVAAVSIDVVLIRPWRYTGGAAVVTVLPVLTVLLPALGAWQFLALRRRSWPLVPAMGFVVGCYGALVVQAAVIA
ncbi:hypothetical protein ACWCP6_29455 [Streptomyces sp. NPDC002004]